jgi:hypothetical protein
MEQCPSDGSVPAPIINSPLADVGGMLSHPHQPPPGQAYQPSEVKQGGGHPENRLEHPPRQCPGAKKTVRHPYLSSVNRYLQPGPHSLCNLTQVVK